MKYPTPKNKAPKLAHKQGSALLTAVVFSTIILLGIAGVMPMLVTDWKLNARTSLQESAFTLAESAVDEAIWAVLEFEDNDAAWRSAGWSEGSNNNYWYREWTLTDLSQEAGEVFELDDARTATYRAIVEKVDGSRVVIVAQGTVSGGRDISSGSSITRYIETEFRKPNPIEGVVSRYLMNLNGSPTFDSYNSDLGEDPRTGPGSGDSVSVGGPSVDLSNFNIANPYIAGDVMAGVPEGGSHPFDMKRFTGEKVYDFSIDFPEVQSPDTSSGTWDTSL